MIQPNHIPFFHLMNWILEQKREYERQWTYIKILCCLTLLYMCDLDEAYPCFFAYELIKITLLVKKKLIEIKNRNRHPNIITCFFIPTCYRSEAGTKKKEQTFLYSLLSISFWPKLRIITKNDFFLFFPFRSHT